MVLVHNSYYNTFEFYGEAQNFYNPIKDAVKPAINIEGLSFDGEFEKYFTYGKAIEVTEEEYNNILAAMSTVKESKEARKVEFAAELAAIEPIIFEEPIVIKRPKGVYNTGFGYYGTAADARRGYDGIE